MLMTKLNITKTRNEISQCVRKDRRAYIENLASQANETVNIRNTRDLTDTTKKNLLGKFKQTGQQVKDNNGKSLSM